MFKKVVIATHVFTPGTSQAFKDYCKKKKFETLFIGHSIFGNVLTWGFGILDTFWKVVKTGQKYDLYVGFDNLNAFVGIWLRKLGKVSKVIFMTPDYSHTRFENHILNSIYHFLDYFCLLTKSDNISAICPLLYRGYFLAAFSAIFSSFFH